MTARPPADRELVAEHDAPGPVSDNFVVTGLPRDVVEQVQQLGPPEDRRVAVLASSGTLVFYRAAGPSRDDQSAAVRADLAAVRELLERRTP